MALSESEILRVLEMFDRSGWSEMQLQSGNVKLLISKHGRISSAPAPSTAPVPNATPALEPTAPPPPTAPAAPTASAVSAPAADPRWIAVKAPMLGHFYATPSPGAAPFVSVGQKVAATDTVAILEVMKLMNHVKAGVDGTVARIEAKSGDMVEFEQVLLYIDPA